MPQYLSLYDTLINGGPSTTGPEQNCDANLNIEVLCLLDSVTGSEWLPGSLSIVEGSNPPLPRNLSVPKLFWYFSWSCHPLSSFTTTHHRRLLVSSISQALHHFGLEISPPSRWYLTGSSHLLGLSLILDSSKHFLAQTSLGILSKGLFIFICRFSP